MAATRMPAVANAQQVTVSGVVVERSQSRPIQDATVRMTGLPAVVTDRSGRFRFTGVLPAHYVLTVVSIGHQFRSLDLMVRSDTTLQIEMEQRIVPLDTVVVRGGTVTIKGNVRDAKTGKYLLQAQVTLYPGSRTIGTTSGDFALEEAPKGEPVTLVIEALEHLPKQITFVATKDTSVIVHLETDSVGMRMIAQQVKRLATRSMAVPYALDALNRDRLGELGETSIGDLLRHRLPMGAIPDRPPSSPAGGCYFYDDLRVPLDVLMHLLPEVIERVEIYGFRGKIIRVYSKRYVASLMREQSLPRVFC